MDSMEDMLGENTGVVILQVLIIILAGIIIGLVYSDRTSINLLDQKIDAIEPSCPKCPSCPACPECSLEGKDCPACNCPEGNVCPACPDVSTSCPKAPECKTITPEDIADAIFPGRNKGLTAHGQYFPLDGLGEGVVEPAYSPVTNLMPNYVGGDGVPAAISFSDQKLLNKKSSIGLASTKAPPLLSTQGVFSKGKKGKKADKPAAGKPAAGKPAAGKPLTDKINPDKKDDATSTDEPEPAGGSGGILSKIEDIF